MSIKKFYFLICCFGCRNFGADEYVWFWLVDSVRIDTDFAVRVSSLSRHDRVLQALLRPNDGNVGLSQSAPDDDDDDDDDASFQRADTVAAHHDDVRADASGAL